MGDAEDIFEQVMKALRRSPSGHQFETGALAACGTKAAGITQGDPLFRLRRQALRFARFLQAEEGAPNAAAQLITWAEGLVPALLKLASRDQKALAQAQAFSADLGRQKASLGAAPGE